MHVLGDIDFGSFLRRLLKGFEEARLLNLRICFNVFAKSILERVSKGQEIDPRGRTRRRWRELGSFFLLRWPRGSWGEIVEWGSQNISDSLIETWPSRSGPGIWILI